MKDHTTQPNPLNKKVVRFDVAGITKRFPEFGSAVESLDSAFHAAYAIECIAQVLIADDGERNSITCADEAGSGQPLNDFVRGGLQTAIYSLAKGLRTSLDQQAEALDRAA